MCIRDRKKGVVRDPQVHEDVLEQILSFSEGLGYFICGLDYSPVKGPQGNIEYLLYLTCQDHQANFKADTKSLVKKSHLDLD